MKLEQWPVDRPVPYERNARVVTRLKSRGFWARIFGGAG
jgi:hypothetical protein